MTRKHFIAVAQGFAKIRDMNARWIAVDAFCSVAKELNPAFKRDVFIAACGL